MTLLWGEEVETFSWPVVELVGDAVALGLRHLGQALSLG